MSELPQDWTLIELGEVGHWFGGGTPSKTVERYWSLGTIPWVSPKDMKSARVGDAQDHITDEAVRNSATNLVAAGSVLVVARSGILKHTLPVAVSTKPVAINQDLKAVKPVGPVNAEYLALALKTYEQEILHSCTKTGTTVHNIELPTFLKFKIPVAPPGLQNRIVTKIEDLFTTLDKSVEYLRTAQDQLKVYRQSLLKQAFEGKLTEQWREKNPSNINLNELLNGVWHHHLALSNSGAKKPSIEKVLSLVISADCPETPKTWNWRPLKALCSFITKGASPGWQGFEYVRSGIPFVRSQNVRWGTVDLSDVAYLDPSFNAKQSKSIIHTGDVLLNLVGASVGRSAIAPKEVAGGNLNQAVAIIRPFADLLHPAFLMRFLNSPWAQHYITGNKADVARANFNLDDIAIMPIPVPPFGEQLAILDQLEQAEADISRTEQVVADSLSYSNNLRQSVLKQAFSGRLVPQDPNDEPATVLVERIKTARANTNGSGSRTRSRKKAPILRKQKVTKS